MSDSSRRIYNFSAGPAAIPEPVLRKTQEALWNLSGSGIGVAEHSHRGPQITEVFAQAQERLRALLAIPDDYEVLFLQGGASTQFYMLPASFLPADRTADYLHTGTWSKKAITEAKRYGTVHTAGSSEAADFCHIPTELSFSERPAYVHYTSNNTISGTQFTREPDVPASAPLFCDASSDILSRPLDIAKYALLYAGAQKNLGPSGVTIVIAKRALVEAGNRDLPSMMQYRTAADKGSMFNTPPTLAVYMVNEVLGWIAEQGGLDAMAERSRARAERLYNTLDESTFFAGTVRADSRSQMNICFRSRSPELDAAFIEAAQAQGLAYLKGHRSVGGMRASLYNAMPQAGVDALVEFMHDFAKQNS